MRTTVTLELNGSHEHAAYAAFTQMIDQHREERDAALLTHITSAPDVVPGAAKRPRGRPRKTPGVVDTGPAIQSGTAVLDPASQISHQAGIAAAQAEESKPQPPSPVTATPFTPDWPTAAVLENLQSAVAHPRIGLAGVRTLLTKFQATRVIGVNPIDRENFASALETLLETPTE